MRLAVYGTLRVGQAHYNNIVNTFGANSIQPVGTGRVHGYSLYHWPKFGFPVAIPAENGIIRVDMLEVTDEVARYIHMLETGADYEDIEVEVVPHGDKCVMYVYKLIKVPDGDWVKGKQ